jgi:hypothetical protein
MQIKPEHRLVIRLKDWGMTSQQLLAMFPDATWNNKHNAWRVMNVLFVDEPFSLIEGEQQ